MGCAPVGYQGENNNAPELAQYANLPIGGTFMHEGYCDKVGRYGEDGLSAFGPLNCGTNGEFAYGGDSNIGCNCYALCGNSCRRKLCKRTKYSGDPYQCCSRGGPDYYTDNGVIKTCDPIYRHASLAGKKCDLSMQTYCSEGDNLFNQTCRNWITATTDGQKVGNGSVDAVLFSVCNKMEYEDRPECGCIVAAKKLKRDFPTSNDIPVQCMYNDCANNPQAYKASSQMGDCNIVHCEMNIEDLEIIAGNPSEFNADFVQACSNTQENPKPSTPDTGTGTGTGDNNTETKSYWWIFWLILVIILLAVGYFLYRYFFSASKSNIDISGNPQNFATVSV